MPISNEGIVVFDERNPRPEIRAYAYRIPSLVRTKKGTLLAFSDVRRNSAADESLIDAGVARSTDGGKTWTYQVLSNHSGAQRSMDSTSVVLPNGNIMVMWGYWTLNGTAWTVHQTQNTPLRNDWDIKYSISSNDGETWTEQASLKSKITNLQSYISGGLIGFLGGVSTGIVMQSEQYKDRVIMPIQVAKRVNGVTTVHTGCLYSDNNGETWTLSDINGLTEANNSENAIIELRNGDLIMSSRRDGGVGSRGAFISRDGGQTWSVYDALHGKFTHGMANGRSGCEGSWIKYVADNGHEIGLLSHPKNTQNNWQRDNITLYAYDFDNPNAEIKEIAVLYAKGGGSIANGTNNTAGYSSMNYWEGTGGARKLSIVFESQEGINFRDISHLLGDIELYSRGIAINEGISGRSDLVMVNPVHRFDRYLYYMAFGGNIDDLPLPVTREEKIVYGICVNGLQGVKLGTTPIINQIPSGSGGSTTSGSYYYSCIAQQSSNSRNNVGGVYNLGSKRITTAKAKIRFALKNTGTHKPTKVGMLLVADNAGADSFVGGRYSHTVTKGALTGASIEYDKVYTFEANFPERASNFNLNQFQFIRPYIYMDKGVTNDTTRAITHGIDIYEIKLTIDGVTHDLLDTTRIMDPVPNGASKVEKVFGEVPEEPVVVKTTHYRCVVQSKSGIRNTVGGIFDLGENASNRITSANIRFRFTLRNIGNDTLNGVGLSLMADNLGPNQFAGNQYNYSPQETKLATVEFDKEYTLETSYVANNDNRALNTYRYIRPYLYINKSAGGDSQFTKVHGVDIHEIALTINGIEYDITNSALIFDPVTPNGKSSVTELKY